MSVAQKYWGLDTIPGIIKPRLQKDYSRWKRAGFTQRPIENLVDATQSNNDLSRVNLEMVHTLVEDGLKPIRHELMTRTKSRKLNAANRQYGLKLEWVAGRQEL